MNYQDSYPKTCLTQLPWRRGISNVCTLDTFGYRNEYLCCLSGYMSDKDVTDVVKEHAEFGTQYGNTQLSKWYCYVCATTSMIVLIEQALTTPTGTPHVRPIGMEGYKRRDWTSLLMEDNTDVFRRTFWSVQVVVGLKPGASKLDFVVTEHLRSNPSHVLLKKDFTNEFNSVWRMSILKECYDNED